MADIVGRFSWPRAWRAAFLLIPLFAAACATRVSSYTPTSSTETANLPRPARVLVMDFTVDGGQVRQDQGIGPRLQRELGGGNAGAARRATAAEVQSAISDTIVAALTTAGLPAQRASADATYAPGDLVVTGRVTRIDEGNRTRRMGIGFGAGKSIVEAVAELYTVPPTGSPVLLQSYNGSADSGRKPGLAIGAASAVSQSSPAIGALSGVSNFGGEARRSPVGKEAESLGHRLATDIGKFAAGRGWIAEAAVPAWQR